MLGLIKEIVERSRRARAVSVDTRELAAKRTPSESSLNTFPCFHKFKSIRIESRSYFRRTHPKTQKFLPLIPSNFPSFLYPLIFHLCQPRKRGAPSTPASKLLLLLATRIPGWACRRCSESLRPAGDARSPTSRGIPQDAGAQHRRPGRGRLTIPACPAGHTG
jgi:hypothetical protein